MYFSTVYFFRLDIYRHHTNQVTGLRGNSQQAEPHIAVPTRESSTKEALFHISHICIEYTFYRIPLEIKFNTRYTAVYILSNDIKKKLNSVQRMEKFISAHRHEIRKNA